MLTVFRALSMASTKIVLTFIVAIFLIMLSILFYPQAYLTMDDFANWLANLDLMRNPSDNSQSNAVVRLLINEATIFGVVTTLVARIIVELLFLLFGGLWRIANPPEPGEAPKEKSKMSFY
ncbi:MAG: hypothetical protein QNI84_09120 [Henriciella sp.]|nr:hypothetical protein [Henriciella sp.]